MPVDPIHPLTDLVDRYLTQHCARGSSRNTIARYEATFALFARFLAEQGTAPDSRALTSETVQRFTVWLRATPIRLQRGTSQRSEAGIHAHLRDMRAFVRWLTEEGVLTRPVRVALPKLPERLFPILATAELASVWESKYLTGRSALATRNRALVALMLDTGLRRSEVAALRLEDVSLDDCLLTVIGKGNKQRRVPFSTSVMHLVRDWLAVRGQEPGSLFWLSSASVRTVFRRIQEETGLERFHPHQLRHQAASMMVRANADVFAVQRILGHADLATTQRYVTQNDADIRAKHAAASPFERLQGILVVDAPPARKRKRLSLAEK